MKGTTNTTSRSSSTCTSSSSSSNISSRIVAALPSSSGCATCLRYTFIWQNMPALSVEKRYVVATLCFGTFCETRILVDDMQELTQISTITSLASSVAFFSALSVSAFVASFTSPVLLTLGSHSIK